ncbi:MAG: Translation initiation factor [Gammaproteobacteria bacterium]|nr:Translation initiation factor [Gammaproteobacteria bacterium]
MIGDDGEQLGVMSVPRALELAQQAGLDLVEISPTATPPVCKIMDHGKYVFQLNKQKHAAKKKQKQVQIKEIKLRPATEEADYQVKLRNLIRFLNDGDKTKITLRFRGRELSHQELGVEVLKRIEADLAEYGVVEQPAKVEGKQMVMVMGPKKKKV